jgi:hypothetical protein
LSAVLLTPCTGGCGIKIPDKYGDPEKSGITQDVPSRGAQDLKFDLQ